MARMLPYKHFTAIAPYELTRYSTGSYYRTQIERSIERERQERDDEEEEANNRYWDDYGGHSSWSDYD